MKSSLYNGNFHLPSCCGCMKNILNCKTKSA
nr:MAG TPA: Spaetzle [Caudoviricetes sp.]